MPVTKHFHWRKKTLSLNRLWLTRQCLSLKTLIDEINLVTNQLWLTRQCLSLDALNDKINPVTKLTLKRFQVSPEPSALTRTETGTRITPCSIWTPTRTGLRSVVLWSRQRQKLGQLFISTWSHQRQLSGQLFIFILISSETEMGSIVHFYLDLARDQNKKQNKKWSQLFIFILSSPETEMGSIVHFYLDLARDINEIRSTVHVYHDLTWGRNEVNCPCLSWSRLRRKWGQLSMSIMISPEAEMRSTVHIYLNSAKDRFSLIVHLYLNLAVETFEASCWFVS